LRRLSGILPAAALAFLGVASPAAKVFLVLCSPGSPGTTSEAQPTLDAFASALEHAAAWSPSTFGAVYFETLDAGLQRLSQKDAALALVPPPFYVEYAQSLSLRARLGAVQESGADEQYSLVAGKGAVANASALADWEITGASGFSSRFVREVVLADWGPLPAQARITFSARPLSSLRRSASGEKVAVLLNREEAAALPSLPFASQLQVLHTSVPLPSGLLCLVGSRLPSERAEALIRALQGLSESAAGRESLQAMHLSGFIPLSAERMKSLTLHAPPPEKQKP
jgi:phosphonate ABC transporter substrate-binding protein